MKDSRFTRERMELVFIVVLCFFIVSCRETVSKSDFSETAAFMQVVDAAEHKVTEGQWEQAKLMVDSAFYSGIPKTVKDTYIFYKFNLELQYGGYKNNQEAFNYTDSVKRLIERNDAIKEMASEYALVYYWRGDIYFSTGDYKEAYAEYYKGREVVKKVLDACGLGDYNYRLGMVLYQQGRYEEAKSQFFRCSESIEYCQPGFVYHYRQQEVLSNIGLCYYKLQQYDSAEHYYQNSLNYIEKQIISETVHQKHLKSAARAVAMGNLASVYEARGEQTKAEAYYKESIRTNRSSKIELKDVLVTNLKLARLYMKNGQEAEMLRVLEEEKQMLEAAPDVEARIDWHYLMSRYYTEKDPALALEHFSVYDHLKDSLATLTKGLRESDVNEHIVNLENERQISALEKRFAEKNNYLIAALIVAAVSIIGILLIVYYVRSLRSYVRKLADLNVKVTEQKKQIEQTMLELELSNKEKDKILRVVAHDLRSPVNAIYSLADLLCTDDMLSAGQREIVDLIKTASNNSLTLSKEILDTAIMQGEEYKMERLNLSELLSQNIELLRFRAAEKDQQIDLEIQQPVLEAMADSDKFSRIIGNIVTNAIKFSKEGAVIDVRLFAEDDNIVLSVRDEGIGIPASISEKVFEMFTEAKREGTSGEKPYGLGLSIARQIVEAHKGKIWFISEEGKGTTFIISIPCYCDRVPFPPYARQRWQAVNTILKP